MKIHNEAFTSNQSACAQHKQDANQPFNHSDPASQRQLPSWPPAIRPQRPVRDERTPDTHQQPTPKTWNGSDETLRPDDPYISKVNKRSFDTSQTIRQLTQQTSKWQDRNGNNKTEISYTFNGNGRNSGFNETQKEQARRSMQSWGDVANLTFAENGGAAEGRLSFSLSNSERTAHGTYPTPNGRGGGQTVYNPRMATRVVITHEIGHALGLSHPGHYNGSANESQRAYAQDSTAHTVMSYFGERSSGKNCGGTKPRAPMMDDISAIQRQYGANYETRKEDTTYGFNSNTQRDFYTLGASQDKAVFCVWDGGGNDTLDFSGYSASQTINLKAGSFSDVGGLKGNVSIAKGVTLENAVGGAGADALIGNEANNRLTGGAGADRLRGGGGADTFVYNNASDSSPNNPDTLMDFTSGVDKIDVSAAMKNARTPALTFVSTLSGKAGEAIITYNEKSGTGTVSIDLTGAGKADLLINTHGQVKPTDFIDSQNNKPTPLDTRVTPAVTPPTPPKPEPKPEPDPARFVFDKASQSTYDQARVLTDFVSGQDKIDLRGVIKEADTPFNLVDSYTGRKGDAIVKQHPQTGRYYIGVDLTGNGRTDFLVKSTQPLSPTDIIGLSGQPLQTT
ncbi:M10 family metallopeptidase C-terminal domain-containing protein [Pseudomonas sp. 15FMM2]|uniref:M10 family metallopeptidase C-terminal domain-containing protein n=1 Tax=Pseudomonas imrae TaxID=2992837 RepID=A0ACC7PLC1_9PSED